MRELITIVCITIVVAVVLVGGLLLVVKLTSGAELQELTWNEYNDYISMLNHEIARQGGSVTFNNVSGEIGKV